MTTVRVGSLELSRIILGMWQVSGGWGDATPDEIVLAMMEAMDQGYNTFALAGHWSPTEELFSVFRQRIDRERGEGFAENNTVALTAWAQFQGQTIGRPHVEKLISNTLRKTSMPKLDLMQLHWGDCVHKGYSDALRHLFAMKEDKLLKDVGVTNFNAEMLEVALDQDIALVSNQVQFSIVDQRPLLGRVQSVCVERGIHLLAYGVLCGGLLTDAYLGSPKPQPDSPSKAKHLQIIELWGGWEQFQDLLWTLREIADKHDVDIAHIAMRWVLDQPGVSAIIIGCRFGLSEHYADGRRALASEGQPLELDDEDRVNINGAAAKQHDLLLTIGDVGDEDDTPDEDVPEVVALSHPRHFVMHTFNYLLLA